MKRIMPFLLLLFVTFSCSNSMLDSTDISIGVDLSELNLNYTSLDNLENNSKFKVSLYEVEKPEQVPVDYKSVDKSLYKILASSYSSINDTKQASVVLNDIPVGINAFIIAEVFEDDVDSSNVLYAGISKVFEVLPEKNIVDLELESCVVDEPVIQNFTLKFILSNQTENEITDIESGSSINIADKVKLDGYNVKFYEDANYSEQIYNTEIVINSDVTIYVELEAITYYIGYVLNDGRWNDYSANTYYTVETAKNFSIPGADCILRDGYVFEGWYDNTGYAIDSLVGRTGNLTLYAKWRGVNQVATVKFSPADDGVDMDTAITLTCETDGSTIYYTTDGSVPKTSKTCSEYNSDEPIIIGNILSGGQEEVTIKAYAVCEEMDDSDVSTITYTLNVYTLNFDATGGTLPDGMQYSVQATSRSVCDFSNIVPTKTGCKFKGWYLSANPDEFVTSYAPNIVNTPNKTVTFYAGWEPIEYKVTFDPNGGTATTQEINQYFTYDVEQELYANPFTRDGYTFTGWNTVKDPITENLGVSYADKQSVINLTTSEEITLYAQWEEAVITLTQAVLDTYSLSNNYRYTLPSGEYCVTEDLSIQYPIVINGEVNLYSDTNHKISLASNYSSDASSSWMAMIVIPASSGPLTLGGGTGNLTIDGTTNSTTNLDYLVMSSGTFNLSDKVTITNGNVNYGAVYIGGGTFTMTGGSIEYNNSKTEGYGAGIHVQNISNTTTVNISGGSVYNNYYSTNTNQFASICNKGGNVTILGKILENEKFTQNIINGNITDEIPIRSWEELVTNINSIPSSKTDTTKFLVTNDLVVTGTCYNYSPITITPVGNVKITTTNYTIFTPNANLTITGDADNTLTLQGNTSTNIGLIDSDCSNEININLQFCNISDGYILVENFENWTMTNCTIKNSSYDYGAFSLNTSGNVTINDCSFESNTYDVYVKNSPSLTLDGTVTIPKIYYDNSSARRDLGIVIGEKLQLKDETKISIEIYSTDKTRYDIDLFNLADGQTVSEEIFTLENESYQINSSTGEIEEIGGGNEPLTGTEVSAFTALQTAINGDDEVIIITSNITITDPLVINKKITICCTSDSNYQLARATEGTVEGPMFEVTSNGELTLQNIIITGGYDNEYDDAKNNPFIYNNGKTVIENSTLKNNYLYYTSAYTNNESKAIHFYGGGAIFSNGDLTINNSSMGNFYINSSGGGTIYIESGTCNIDGLTISSCSTNYNGAALYISENASSSTVNINNSNIVSNTANTNGGGIYAAAGTININNSEINTNSATNDGNSVYFKKDVIYSINGNEPVTVTTTSGYDEAITSSTSSISIN